MRKLELVRGGVLSYGEEDGDASGGEELVAEGVR